ncbi:MAG: hypothetical protein LCH39_05440, partial [Proteobacteria bacterium]|nr:hypothetical protein [Pseudomonadota bacterium]
AFHEEWAGNSAKDASKTSTERPAGFAASAALLSYLGALGNGAGRLKAASNHNMAISCCSA